MVSKERLTVIVAGISGASVVLTAVWFLAEIRQEARQNMRDVATLQENMRRLNEAASNIGEVIGEQRATVTGIGQRQDTMKDFLMDLYRREYGVHPRLPGDPPPGH